MSELTGKKKRAKKGLGSICNCSIYNKTQSKKKKLDNEREKLKQTPETHRERPRRPRPATGH